eukprot:6189602-Pyramimonas_sp.AAC.1
MVVPVTVPMTAPVVVLMGVPMAAQTYSDIDRSAGSMIGREVVRSAIRSGRWPRWLLQRLLARQHDV